MIDFEFSNFDQMYNAKKKIKNNMGKTLHLLVKSSVVKIGFFCGVARRRVIVQGNIFRFFLLLFVIRTK